MEGPVRTGLIALIAFALTVGAVSAQQSSLASPLVVVATTDTGALKGEPTRLAWSPDGSVLYLQAADRDHFGQVKSTTNFLVSVRDRSMKKTDKEPDWAEAYWSWKSGHNSPASRSDLIDVQTRQESVRATSAPTGGDLARGGVDTGGGATQAGDVASTAYQTQTNTIYTLKWKGATIGEWKNEAVVPGANFTWAPAPRVALAYAPRAGGPITVVDEHGNKEALAGSTAALLPAWSQDGAKLAWLERKDKKHFDIVIGNAPAK